MSADAGLGANVQTIIIATLRAVAVSPIRMLPPRTWISGGPGLFRLMTLSSAAFCLALAFQSRIQNTSANTVPAAGRLHAAKVS
jgi:hypothetical protein